MAILEYIPVSQQLPSDQKFVEICQAPSGKWEVSGPDYGPISFDNKEEALAKSRAWADAKSINTIFIRIEAS